MRPGTGKAASAYDVCGPWETGESTVSHSCGTVSHAPRITENMFVPVVVTFVAPPCSLTDVVNCDIDANGAPRCSTTPYATLLSGSCGNLS
jgi:hypothetical protein